MSNLIPEGWIKTQFGNITASIKSGLSRRIVSQDIGIPVLISGNIQNNRLDPSELKYWYTNDPQGADTSRYLLNDNDILLCFINSLAQIGKVCVYRNIGRPAIYTTNLFRVIAHTNLSSSYVYQLMTYQSFQEEIQLITKPAVNQASFTKTDLENISVVLPPLPEQKKIAAILTSVDNVIEKTEAQIDKLKDLKKGMMQELLTKGVGVDGKPHTEFKDSPVGRIPKGWEVVCLTSLIDMMESGWSPQCEPKKAQIGDWCILKTTAVSWKGFNYSANKRLPDSLEPRINIQVKSKDILVTRAGPADRVGVIVHVDSVPDKVMLSDKIIRLKTKDKCNSKFLSLWLSSNFPQNFMAIRVSGLATSQTNISQLILSSVPCIFPSIQEQNIIAKSISTIDKKFNIISKKLLSQKQLKKALMQDLLTGKVRVKIDG